MFERRWGVIICSVWELINHCNMYIFISRQDWRSLMTSEAEVKPKFLCQAQLQLEWKAWPLNPDKAQMKYLFFAILAKQKLHMLCCCWIMMSIQRNLIQSHAYYFSTLLGFPNFIFSLDLKSSLIYPSDMFIWVSSRHQWLNISKTDSWFFLTTCSS